MSDWGIATILQLIAREATLFAAVGFLIGGIDDLAIDLIWLTRVVRRRLAGGSAWPEPAQPAQHRLAIFVPAWDEAAVIAPMLRHALATLVHPDYRIYVGTYSNDRATRAAVAAVADRRIRQVVGATPGPTTKGDNLNNLWHALARDEARDGWRADAIILHDAEDVVHAQELAIYDRLLVDHAVVQLPVLPLIARGARWVSGHYADEFADGHARLMVVRQAVGAGMPLAGVGCAIRRDALDAVAKIRGGAPFDPTSLTEDYELGLRIADLGGRGCFARVRESSGRLVAVRGYFPASVATAVVQKARWMTGIALIGWDRIGWAGWRRMGDHWMRMRDRRALLAVIVLASGYLAIVAHLAGEALRWATGDAGVALSGTMKTLLGVNAVLLGWRLVMRAVCTGHAYGWREGLRSVPRVVVANFIALLAMRRAVTRYIATLRGAATVWDKTRHAFPEDPAKC